MIEDVLRQAIDARAGTPDLRLTLEVVLLRSENTNLRKEVEQLKADRRKWFRLLAAVLKVHGRLRIPRFVEPELRVPSIRISDDLPMNEHVLDLVTG